MSLARLGWLIWTAAVAGVLLVEAVRHNWLDHLFSPAISGLISNTLLVLGAGLFTEHVLHWITRMNGQLAQQQMKLSAVFDNSSDAIILTDAHARILSANPATERLTGRREGELANTHLWESLCRDSEGHHLAPEKCPVTTVTARNQAIPYLEMTVATGKGELLPVTASFSPVRDSAGKTVQVAVVIRDLSEKRALEAQVSRLLVETKQQRHRAEALYEVGRDLASLRAAPWSPEPVLERVRELLAADLALFAVLDPVQGQIACQAAGTVLDPDRLATLRLRPGQEIPGRVISSGHLLRVEEFPGRFTYQPEAYPLMQAEALAACLAVPVGVRGEVAGALLVGYRVPRAFSEGDVQFLENVAAQMAIALENARLYRQTEQVAMLEERDRLAREIHDGLAQSLAALHLRLQALSLTARGGASQEAACELERLQAACAAAYGEARRAILNLRQRLPAGTDLGGYLAEYLHQFGRDHALAVSVSLPEGGVPALAPAAEAQLIRILQEALHNVVRHARACIVEASLTVQGRQLLVSLRDDGTGFDAAAAPAPGHFGLAIMRERAEQAGGSLTVQSAPGAGTLLQIRLPLAEPEWGPAEGGRKHLGAHSSIARG